MKKAIMAVLLCLVLVMCCFGSADKQLTETEVTSKVIGTWKMDYDAIADAYLHSQGIYESDSMYYYYQYACASEIWKMMSCTIVFSDDSCQITTRQSNYQTTVECAYSIDVKNRKLIITNTETGTTGECGKFNDNFTVLYFLDEDTGIMVKSEENS